MLTLLHLDPTPEQARAARDLRFSRDHELVEQAAKLYQAGAYREVATIDGDQEYAFRATQNGVLSDSWSQEPPTGVTPLEPSFHLHDGQRYGRKSTDIGDLVRLDDGTLMVVATFGFAKLAIS